MGDVRCATLNRLGNLLATGSADGIVKFYDLDSFALVYEAKTFPNGTIVFEDNL